MLSQGGEQRLTTLVTDFKSGKADLIGHGATETTKPNKLPLTPGDGEGSVVTGAGGKS